MRSPTVADAASVGIGWSRNIELATDRSHQPWPNVLVAGQGGNLILGAAPLRVL